MLSIRNGTISPAWTSCCAPRAISSSVPGRSGSLSRPMGRTDFGVAGRNDHFGGLRPPVADDDAEATSETQSFPVDPRNSL
jgi:hypothetical protein